MLADAKSDCRAPYRTMIGSHSIPNRKYIRIRHHRRCHACGTVNCIVIAPDKFRQYIDVSVRVSVRHVFVQLIANRAMAMFYYRAFHIRVSTDLKLNASFLNISWNFLFINSLPYLYAPKHGVCVLVSNPLRVSTEM